MRTTLPLNELLRPISAVAERLTGKRPSPATTWRWLHKGCHGVKLNALMLGGQWLCTEQDFRDFLEQQTAAKLAQATVGSVTNEKLEAAGLL